jgi:hypothetical protein
MRRALAPALLSFCLAHTALAQAPAPIDPQRDNFPGAFTSPASAPSGGLALADRWLADEPFSNPALAARGAVSVTPLFVLTSRQDLRAENRDFTDQGGSIDLAGAYAALPLGKAKRLTLHGYFWQPVLRFEDNAFTLGTATSIGPPATLSMSVSQREWIAGFGLAAPLGRTRLGAALEWSGRSDSYSTHEESGAPTSGDSKVDFSGSAMGAQFGARSAFGSAEHPLELGVAARYHASLDVTGTQDINQIGFTGSAPISATRAAAWGGGASLRVPFGPTLHMIVEGAARGAQDWSGFGITAGQSAEWKLAGEYHDERDPWTFRFAGGEELEDGVPEPRAGVYAVGLGWRLKHSSIDVSLTHRTLQRPGEPNSYDERLLLGLSLP